MNGRIFHTTHQSFVMFAFRISKLLLPFLLFSGLNSFGQMTNQENYDALKKVITDRDFCFLPASATTINNNFPVDPGFKMRLMKDSLNVDLPLFESGYAVNFGSNDDRIKYATKEFTYTSEETKKGGWIITILSKDESRLKKIYINIPPDGHCTFRLYVNNKQPITYYGIIGDNLTH
jgi:hypothetical protein